jgi:glutathione synthase/RimK-type ligase-like ATP-grasp enzyme
MVILLWGLAEEAPMRLVHEALASYGAPVVMVDQASATGIDVCLEVDGQVGGWLRVDGDPRGVVDLAGVSAVYVRPYDSAGFSWLVEDGPARQHVQALEETLRCWLEATPAWVVNRLEPMASNESKPYQLSLIRRSGFDVPDTLITTDPAAAQAFWERHGQVIYKSVSGVRSVVSRLDVSHLPRLANVAHCPTQFQEYIPGRDVRAHVVGGEVYACEIITDAADYRYPGDSDVTMEPCRLPVEIEARCVDLAAALDLLFAGVDLRRAGDGRWVCFEVNPCPGFSYYQRRTGLPIADAVARLLMADQAR